MGRKATELDPIQNGPRPLEEVIHPKGLKSLHTMNFRFMNRMAPASDLKNDAHTVIQARLLLTLLLGPVKI